jgi:hypothetical protein
MMWCAVSFQTGETDMAITTEDARRDRFTTFMPQLIKSEIAMYFSYL